MKKIFPKVAVLSTVLLLGVGSLFFNKPNSEVEVVVAETHNPHVDNYNSYTYSGSYYSTISDSLTSGLNGTLRINLGKLILPKAWYTYSGSSEGTLGKILQSADQDPNNSSNMILFYSRDSITKRAAGGNVDDWNREHVWPQNLSNGHWGKEKAGTDLLHIRPTWSTTNSKRSDTKYGDTSKANAYTYEGMTYAYGNGSYFEPLDTVKGDVARILMYTWTAYYDYYKDDSLLLTKVIQSYDVLLKWHTLDKPDQLEGNRNNFSEISKQKNRNPFVDHPEYAWQIFGEKVSQTVLDECKAAYPGNGSVTPPGPGGDSSSSNPGTSSEEPGPISSSEPASSTPTSTSSNNGRNGGMKKGCHGSIGITTLSIASLGSVVGLVFIFSKKKKK